MSPEYLPILVSPLSSRAFPPWPDLLWLWPAMLLHLRSLQGEPLFENIPAEGVF